MKAVLFALIGIVLYAIQNTIIDVRLSHYKTAELLIGWYVMMLPLGAAYFLYQRFLGGGATIPAGTDFLIVAATAVMFFVADYFYLGAYTKYGGGVVTVTIVAVLMPVLGAALKFAWVGEKPTWYHAAAFLCAALAVVFVALGNKHRSTAITLSAPTGISGNR